jgi:hypothetical protein
MGRATKLRAGRFWFRMLVRTRDFLQNVVRSPPSSAKVKNEWNCISAPPVFLCGMVREDFTFILVKCLYFKCFVGGKQNGFSMH